jgi:hypothetical protein
MVAPSHTVGVPNKVPATARGFTVRILDALQPDGEVYVIITVPPAMPVTTPLVATIVAIDGEPDCQVPPAGVLVSVAVAPTQTPVAILLTDGNGFIVTVAVFIHPVENRL